MKVLMRKQLGALRPVDEAGEELLQRIRNNDVVSVEVKRPRNVGHHRKFFALLNLVYQNQERYQSVEQLLSVMKVALGHCEMLIMKDGREVYIPKSIAFHKMDQTEFEQFWDKCVALIVTKILPGVTKEHLEQEILELLG